MYAETSCGFRWLMVFRELLLLSSGNDLYHEGILALSMACADFSVARKASIFVLEAETIESLQSPQPVSGGGKSKKNNNNFDDSLTLRMHRGKGVGALMASTMRTHNMLIEGATTGQNGPPPPAHPPACSSASAPQISISCPSGTTSHLTSPTASINSTLQINLHHNGGSSSGRPLRDSRRKSVFKEAPAGISRDLSPNSSKKLGKKHLKVQVKRFRMETKAAKTLAIIVGGFIFCWLPFFTMYLVRAFCDDCINDTLFSILFWLGYCNSAVNPFIYALFSRDFRQAFKRIIMRCFCWKRFKINLLKKSSTTHQHTNNHSYSPSAFTPLASTPRTELDSSVFR